MSATPTATAEAPLDFDALAAQLYAPLERFARKLTGEPELARDLTQQAFYLAIQRQGQIRDPQRVKSWLFSILFREFLQRRRHETRFPKQSISEQAHELPGVPPARSEDLDAVVMLQLLSALEEHFRAPLALFYLEDRSYREISERLRVPIGTVMSRLSRGKQLLRERMETVAPGCRPRWSRRNGSVVLTTPRKPAAGLQLRGRRTMLAGNDR